MIPGGSRRLPRRLAALLLALGPAATSSAQPVTLKMATLVPEGSSWYVVLKEMAEKWKTASGGRVLLRVYPGGVAGDDPDVVRKMRQGTLHAGVLTAVGLAEIEPSVHALSVPMLYDSHDEAYAVLSKMRPRLEAAFEAKGFVVLNWADAGWVHFFARKPVGTPDDLRALKLFTWAGDPRTEEVWRSVGFNPVPLPSTEIMTALQSGTIDAHGCPPQVAVIAQYYNHARNMTDLPWQLLLGATVMSRSAWAELPAEVRPALREAAADAGRRLQAQVRQSVARDVAAMTKRGLTVVPVGARARTQWEKLAEGLYPKLRGGIVPAEAFDEAMRHRDEYRKQAAASPR